MNDSGFKPQLDAVVSDLIPVLHELTGKHDFRLLAAVFIQEAVALLQSGISAGVLNGEQATQYLAAAIPQVLEPRKKKAVAIYSDGGTILGRKN